jgi:hypothetical protein
MSGGGTKSAQKVINLVTTTICRYYVFCVVRLSGWVHIWIKISFRAIPKYLIRNIRQASWPMAGAEVM